VIEVRRDVVPAWPLRPGRPGLDGLVRRRGAALERLVHVEGRPAVVRWAVDGAGRLAVRAMADARDTAEEAIARVRFALGADDDLRPFYEAFRDDPLIGASVRARPHLRVPRRPDPFEALVLAVTEQLIEYRRAVAIQRRLIARHGRADPATGLRDLPDAAAVAALAPAQLQALDLAGGRAGALRRAAREVAGGRVDLRAADPEPGWARLRAIPGIGTWTIDVLALHGQGRDDHLPAGDLAYLKLVGRLLHGEPRARATEAEVRELFAPYGRWAGLAGAHALGAPTGQGSLRATAPVSRPPGPSPTSRRPRPAGTRWSARPPRREAA
jgi:3-methyladenine DNA glycosylase/8-oxoguanine DNA glycosylase